MTSPPAGTTDPEPLLVRFFEAPRPLVYEAWTDSGRLAQWIAPEGFTIPPETVTIEPWAGGRFDYCMLQLDTGDRFWLRNRFAELTAPRLLVLRSAPMPEHGVPEPITTRVELHDDPADAHRTRLTFTRPYPPARRGGAQAGWNSSFDKLAALLRHTGP